MYPHHHGRVHTLLPGPVTITEKGVEQGQVIWVHLAEGNDTWQTFKNFKNVLDWSEVGGVMGTAQELEDGVNYVLGLEDLTRWSSWNYKQSWYPCL